MANVGRPLKFASVEELQEKINDYFNNTLEEELTITGLALALDTDRQTLINYQNREEYFDTIKKAKTRIEHSYEKALRKNGRTGDIFALKNFGWTDKQEIESNVNMNAYSNLSEEELRALANGQ